MKTGANTIRAVLDSVVYGNLSTRKDISEALGISKVSVSSAVDSLLNASLLSVDGKISSGGRQSEHLCPAYSQKYLLINLCEKPFSYAFVYIGEELTSSGSFYPSVQRVPYISDLDFGDNLISFANKVSSGLDCTPRAVAIATSGKYDEEKDIFVFNNICDYAGTKIKETFASHGICVDSVVSRSEALTNSSCVKHAEKPCVYLSVGERILGLFCRSECKLEFDWSESRVGSLSYYDTLRCGLDDRQLTERSRMFVDGVKDILKPKNVFLDTNMLPVTVSDKLVGELGYLTNVTDSAPVLDGLLNILTGREILKIRANSQK